MLLFALLCRILQGPLDDIVTHITLELCLNDLKEAVFTVVKV